MVFVLQQFDGLILGPKILGESTGVRPLLILFSITVGGAYFGPLGMFLGVPFFATVQFLIGNWVDYRLYKKNIKLEKEAAEKAKNRGNRFKKAKSETAGLEKVE